MVCHQLGMTCTADSMTNSLNIDPNIPRQPNNLELKKNNEDVSMPIKLVVALDPYEIDVWHSPCNRYVHTVSQLVSIAYDSTEHNRNPINLLETG